MIRIRIVVVLIILLCINSSLSFAESDEVKGLVRGLWSFRHKSRMEALERLEALKDYRSVDGLIDLVLLESDDWRIKIRALRLLGDIGDRRAIVPIVRVFKDPDINKDCPAIMWNALAALREFGGDSYIADSISDYLKTDNLMIKEAVIETIGTTGGPDKVYLLSDTIWDDSFAVRLSAVKAIAKMGGYEAEEMLLDAASSDPDPNIRQTAETALQEIDDLRRKTIIKKEEAEDDADDNEEGTVLIGGEN